MVEENFMTREIEKGLGKIGVTVSKPIMALIAIVFGILVIVFIEYFELRRRAQG
jgi:hypothetical protein